MVGSSSPHPHSHPHPLVTDPSPVFTCFHASSFPGLPELGAWTLALASLWLGLVSSWPVAYLTNQREKISMSQLCPAPSPLGRGRIPKRLGSWGQAWGPGTYGHQNIF